MIGNNDKNSQSLFRFSGVKGQKEIFQSWVILIFTLIDFPFFFQLATVNVSHIIMKIYLTHCFLFLQNRIPRHWFYLKSVFHYKKKLQFLTNIIFKNYLFISFPPSCNFLVQEFFQEYNNNHYNNVYLLQKQLEFNYIINVNKQC